MSQHPILQELHAFADSAYGRSLLLMLRADESGERPTHEQLEEHRIEIVAGLLETLSRVEPGLGETLFAAMYPLAIEVR